MRTSYLQRNKRRSPYLWQAGILVAVLVAGALFFTLSSGRVSSLLAPVWRGQNAVSRSLAASLSWTQTRAALLEENQALKEELASREAELISLRISAEREDELLGMLGRNESGEAVLAGVLVRPPLTPYDVIIVDAGEKHGIEIGDTASMPEGPVLGTVVEVDQSTSKVRLYSASGEKTSAVLERHSVPVILVGQGGGSFALNLPRDVEVEPGDKILSPGADSRLLAVVGGVDMAPTDSFKKVLVKGASNIFTIRYVILTP